MKVDGPIIFACSLFKIWIPYNYSLGKTRPTWVLWRYHFMQFSLNYLNLLKLFFSQLNRFRFFVFKIEFLKNNWFSWWLSITLDRIIDVCFVWTIITIDWLKLLWFFLNLRAGPKLLSFPSNLYFLLKISALSKLCLIGLKAFFIV